jgi:hypothetical protein
LLSKEERLENVNRVLRLLMEDVGEQWIKMALINPKSDAYRGVAETTWADLKSQHLIQDGKDGCVLLTSHGWEMGLRLTVRDIAEMRESLERICKSIQSVVADTSSRATVSPVRLGRVASNCCGLHAGFVANVVEARLIESWLNRRGVTWASGFEGRMLMVPVDFGSDQR